MSKATEDLKVFLNKVVEQSDGIDAVFVYNLGQATLLYQSTAKAREGADRFVEAVATLGDLRSVGTAVDKFAQEAERGDLEYATFYLTKGILLMYFVKFDDENLAIGFVNTSTEIGTLNYYSKKYINEIKDKLQKAL